MPRLLKTRIQSSLQRTVSKGKESSPQPTHQQNAKSSRSSKNLVKNYGRAISNFAASRMAQPYINKIQSKHGWDIDMDFLQRIFLMFKEKAQSIYTLRKVLLSSPDDSLELKRARVIFQEIAAIFIKYFAVNWIFSGRMNDKKEHLDNRFKILRRIQNPTQFTYLNYKF